jgi:hypothetical protein
MTRLYKRFLKISFCILFTAFYGASFSSCPDKKISQFIFDELKHYPKARLVDLYKNYFQDAYGPGHIIPDTTRAGNYLSRELQQPDWTDSLLYQPLGTNHDFYRINLLLIKNRIIPRDTLLLAMVKNASMARKPDIESWKKEWETVLRVVKLTYPGLPKLKADEKLIAKVLSQGVVIMHHSKHYEETYHPHYRIIHKSVFEVWRKKYLKQIDQISKSENW